MLNNFWAGFGGAAPIQNACGGSAANRIRIGQPPLRSFAPRLVEFEHAIGLCPAKIQGDPTAGNNRPHAIVHLRTGFALIEPEVQPPP